ncbi:MAG TPA: putative molybdenum carrier protein [Kofleriaceae bacterium]
MLVILHTGQTGVERGADRAARAVGTEVSGFCSFEKRDEIGVLPPEILADLSPCAARGARSALRATLETATVLVIVVQNRASPNAETGVEALRRNARKANVPVRIVDPESDLVALANELHELENGRVMITGPRGTRWPAGERLGWRVVAELALNAPQVTDLVAVQRVRAS